MTPSLGSACSTNTSRHTWQRLAINKTRIISPTLNISPHGLFDTNVGCSFHGLLCSRALVGQIKVWRHASHESAVTWLPQTGSWSRNREVLVNTSASLWITVAGSLRKWLDRLTRQRVGVYSAGRWDIWRLVLFLCTHAGAGFLKRTWRAIVGTSS